MSDTISRAGAIDALERIFDRCEEIEAHLPEGDPDRAGYKMYPDWLKVWNYLRQLPSAQQERKKGKWILECDGEGECDNLYRCSECGCEYSCQEYDIPNFCPNCGSYNGGENHDKG